jgi:hypothetical protein
MRFVIRKLNPLVDFPANKMPQIFTSFVSNRKVSPDQKLPEAAIRKNIEDLKNIIIAGLVEPKLDDKLSIDDIISNSLRALKLYTEILVHSLNAFKGLKGLFFSTKIRQLLYIEYQKNLAGYPIK